MDICVFFVGANDIIYVHTCRLGVGGPKNGGNKSQSKIS